jgi:uncharacterized protein (TIGR03663 family)
MTPPQSKIQNPKSKICLLLALLVALAVAAGFRLPQLGVRPMHADEAAQAAKTGLLYDKGEYHYDLNDLHGPSLYWLSLPSLWLRGVQDFAASGETDYRLVTVLFGIAAVGLVLLLADGLGWPAAVTAAGLTALSPAMVFYSRYYIQEMLLVVFTLLAIGCGWRYARSGRTRWAVAAGVAVGLMYATKETWILSAAAMAAALAGTLAWARLREGAMPSLGPRLRIVPLLAALGAALLVAAAFYSGFGQHGSGLWDSLLAYGNYWRRGSQGGQQAQPWPYYFAILTAWRPVRHLYAPEAAILILAALGAVLAFSERIRHTPCAAALDGTRRVPDTLGLVRFLALYSFVLAALYSVIRYKTPWCLLGFLDGMVLVAAAGPWLLVRRWPGLAAKLLAAVLLAAAAAHLGWQCWLVNFRIPLDQRHPFGHTYTSPDMPKLSERLEQLARDWPEGHDMVVHVIVPDNYWPLPWYLRRFHRVGYWLDVDEWRRAAAAGPPPSVLVFAAELQPEIDAGLHAAYNGQMLYGLRPPLLVLAYVREDVWKRAGIGD